MRVPILDRVELEEPVSDGLGVSERVAVCVPEVLGELDELGVGVRDIALDLEAVLETVPDRERVGETVAELDLDWVLLGVVVLESRIDMEVL